MGLNRGVIRSANELVLRHRFPHVVRVSGLYTLILRLKVQAEVLRLLHVRFQGLETVLSVSRIKCRMP